uniref:Uncharacterized protein n=1 Tax=Brassica oleracea TaxID=3712 RepID=A0A3P6EPQ5_BRAOL|nr:unnamed protein product [Brassica oleracea]
MVPNLNFDCTTLYLNIEDTTGPVDIGILVGICFFAPCA